MKKWEQYIIDSIVPLLEFSDISLEDVRLTLKNQLKMHRPPGKAKIENLGLITGRFEVCEDDGQVLLRLPKQKKVKEEKKEIIPPQKAEPLSTSLIDHNTPSTPEEDPNEISIILDGRKMILDPITAQWRFV